jgi:hypothetical protein
MEENTIAFCESCDEEIHYGETYVTLTRRVEKRLPKGKKKKDEVQVFEHRCFWLCSTCASHLTEKQVEAFIKSAQHLEPEYSYSEESLGQ